MNRGTSNDVNEELSANEAYNQIANRFARVDGSVELSTEELIALDLKRRQYNSLITMSVESDNVVSRASHNVDSKSYYLVRVSGNKWLDIRAYNNLIERDGGTKWVVRKMGNINVSGIPLESDWDSEPPTRHYEDDALNSIYEYYISESERMFDCIDEVMGSIWDGRCVHMELREPWIGWESTLENFGIDMKDWLYDIRPAVVKGRSGTPRHIEDDLTAEYSVEVEFKQDS